MKSAAHRHPLIALLDRGGHREPWASLVSGCSYTDSDMRSSRSEVYDISESAAARLLSDQPVGAVVAQARRAGELPDLVRGVPLRDYATHKPVIDDDALHFAERVISLIDAGKKSATYKLAVLLALMDLSAEGADAVAGAPGTLSGKAVAGRVIELYWPQTTVYCADPSGAPRSLRQSPQNDIPAKLAAWRALHTLPPGATLSDARLVDPPGWDELEENLVTTVIGMPLSKLQRFGDGRTAVEERFIYDFDWADEVPRSRVQRVDFDDRLHLRPGVGELLIRLAPLLRPLVQTKWTALVAKRNTDLVDSHQLGEFLFGAKRVGLDRVRAPLRELQAGKCFYCEKPMQDVVVDHFLPWTRHPDNSIDNLVGAHSACNGAKSASIAAHKHLEAWVARLDDEQVGELASLVGWPRRSHKIVGAVTATYRWLPTKTRLWVSHETYEPVDHKRIQDALVGLNSGL